jgi:hypothetical protein
MMILPKGSLLAELRYEHEVDPDGDSGHNARPQCLLQLPLSSTMIAEAATKAGMAMNRRNILCQGVELQPEVVMNAFISKGWRNLSFLRPSVCPTALYK